MNQIVQPFHLTEQQAEYILSGYAAFLDPEKIFEEFCACFPMTISEFKKDEAWKQRLQISIQNLYPGHPECQERYGAMFASMRRKYLSTLEGEKLSSARARLRIMEETIEELDAHGERYQETFVDCKKLKLEVLKAAQKESYAFQESQVGKHGLTEEEIESMVSELPDEEFEEFRKRYKSGEHPDSILMDIQRRVRIINKGEEPNEETQTLEERQEEEAD